ncbi:MAG TPA: alpha/beta fold hydrolase [Pseudomonas sp.]|nr:alpha/beta fold hydrolase [Pseudomonas sp.]
MLRHSLGILLAALLLTGCQLLDLQQQIDSAHRERVLIPGHWLGSEAALVALLDQQGQLQGYRDVQPDGLFYFSAAKAQYQLLAFVDRNRNLQLDPDEPYHWLRQANNAAFQVQPTAAQRRTLGQLNLLQPQAMPSSPAPSLNLSLENLSQALPRLQHNYLQVVDFDDPRFSAERISQGAWQPLDFLSEVGYGLYLLQPWDAHKEPVFLVHGINSAPPIWQELIASIDPQRFQVVLFHYPGGMPLNNSAYILSEAIRDMQRRYAIPRFHIFAHSMGGLVARRTIQLLEAGGGAQQQCLFVTLATPWGGHPSAASGVANSPVVAPVWRDLAPGSPYLQALFATPLPAHIRQWQLVSYAGNTRLLAQPNDGVVPLSSELLTAAQDEADQLFMLADNHTGILASTRSKELIARALGSLPSQGCPP